MVLRQGPAKQREARVTPNQSELDCFLNIIFFKKESYLFYFMGMYMYLSVYMGSACMQVSVEVRKRCQIP